MPHMTGIHELTHTDLRSVYITVFGYKHTYFFVMSLTSNEVMLLLFEDAVVFINLKGEDGEETVI